MRTYRRAWVPGGTFFFTVVTYRRRPLFADGIARDILGQAIRTVKSERPFEINAWVLLPDHMHAVWTLPGDDTDYPGRWAAIKARFTMALKPALHEPALATRWMRRSRRHTVWQRGYWEHVIRDDDDLARHIDYCHVNPVKHGLVDNVADWPHSTFHGYVRDGIYPDGWGKDVRFSDAIGHE